MTEQVKLRRPTRKFWQAGAIAAGNAVSRLLGGYRNILSSPSHETEWNEWYPDQDEWSGFPLGGISQTEEMVKISLQTPGYGARDLEVGVQPEQVSVHGESTTFKQKEDGPVYFAEFGERRMRRIFALPVRIVPETARAYWEDGVLHILARKLVMTPKTAKVELAA